MRGSRTEHPLALLAVGFILLIVCVLLVGFAWFKLEPDRPPARKEWLAVTSVTPPPALPEIWTNPASVEISARESLPDPVLGPLNRAAVSWRGARGLRRRVVDQVYLVPDLVSFLEAIGEWDASHFFPILIDDPTWTLPFLRAFHPAQVVRFASKTSIEGREAIWTAAVRAVGRSWSRPGASGPRWPDGGSPPKELGKTPPAVVLSDPDSAALAGGIALAAGRFQPLLRFEVPLIRRASEASAPEQAKPQRPGFSTVLSLAEARSLAKRVEDRVSDITPEYWQLGDACDFLTIAGEWPYRYLNDREEGLARGENAVDDLIGRILEPDVAKTGKSRDRWAFVGRLLGDAPASVYRAMCSLFLTPDSTVLWNTYGSNPPWNHYGMDRAAEVLARELPGPIRHRFGSDANILNWHRLGVGPIDRTRLIFINSSGEPKRFAIEGGNGRPADLPPGGPAAVVIIHSFSAANPTDPRTIAGRWLLLGAFAYLGSMNEPYLAAFRPPAMEAELLATGIPLGAAVREGPAEPFGQPWRLVYLGDPLYLFDRPSAKVTEPSQAIGSGRLDPRTWKRPSLDSPNVSIEAIATPSPTTDAAGKSPGDARLHWCLAAAIIDTLGEEKGTGAAAGGVHRGPDWRMALAAIDRERLSVVERPIWDALVIDAIGVSEGEQDTARWYAKLSRIPANEWSPKVEAMMEFRSTHRLASAIGSEDFGNVLAIWDEAIQHPWPAGSEFLSQLTERVAAQAVSDRELQQWLDCLQKAEATIPRGLETQHALSIVSAESKRIEARLSGSR